MEDFKVTGIHCGCGNCHHDCGDEKQNHGGECSEHNECCGEGNSCCCSNEHSHNTSNDEEESHSKIKTILLVFSAVVTVLCVILHLSVDFNPIIIGIACGVATIIAGNETFIKGIKSAIKLKLDETTLLTIAVIAAFCLGEFTEAALVTILFQFGELLEDVAVSRSKKNIETLAKIRPDKAILIENGEEVEVPAENVKIGSTILVKPYERIPLDGTVVQGNSSIDTSAITGESVPVEGTPGTEVMSGMQNGEGVIKVVTNKTAENSAASRILKMVGESQKNKGESEKFITRFAKVYTPIVIVISVLVAVVPTLIFGDFSLWLYRALVCLVASCPCAIVISVPLAYFAGIGGASKKGIMIKGGKYVEALSKADCFVFDKTGTLTTGKIKVGGVTAFGGISESEILSYCASAEEYSTHPIALAIKTKAEESGIAVAKADNITEKAGYGVSAEIDGKKISVGGVGLLTDDDKDKVKDNSSVFLIVNGKLQGGITVTDTIREESKEVLDILKSMGANQLVMLTGDREDKAKNIAHLAGITKVYSNLLPDEKVSHMK
ncbi:MAG: heavy metal translocating P-type ATPase, partial [Ruminococcus sp.]